MLKLDDRRFNRLALGAVVVGFILLFGAFAAVVVALGQARQSAQWVDHTYRVVDRVAELDVWIERSETASRGYLLSPGPARLATFRENSTKLAPAIANLAAMTGDNPVQQRNIRTLRQQVAEEMATLWAIMEKAVAGDVVGARADFVREVANQRVNGIRRSTLALRQEEQRLLVERTTQEHGKADLTRNILVLTGILLILLGIGATWLVRRYTADLTGARDRLNLLNTDLEGAVRERTVDLQRANDEIQRFAYIVSHDLRSPLVNIMGFTAELETTNATLGGLIARAENDAPALLTDEVRNAQLDLPEAIGFIRASTQKMDRLINAILKLSREGRRTLTPEQLPMHRVLEGIVQSLEQRLIETGATITVEKSVPELVGDRVAIEQIFSNLIENAVKYLQSGRPGEIIVRGSRKAGRAIYEIVDNGRGIDPRDHQRVFDLFRRSGAQDRAGEGIGLAHVRALVIRLGGTIDLESSLGEGSTFRVSLPETFVDQGVAP